MKLVLAVRRDRPALQVIGPYDYFVGFLDGMAAKRALSRLQTAGVAPAGERAVDFETTAVPGSAATAPILLLTDAAVYYGRHNAVGGIRLSLQDIGCVAIDRQGRSVRFEIRRRNLTLFADLTVTSARAGFLAAMTKLAAQHPAPPKRFPHDLVPGAVRTMNAGTWGYAEGDTGIPTLDNLETCLVAAEDGTLAVCTPFEILWSASIDDVTTLMAEDLSTAATRGAAEYVFLELVRPAGNQSRMRRVGLYTRNFGLFEPTALDKFCLEAPIDGHLQLTTWMVGDDGAELLPLVATDIAQRAAL